MNLFQEYINWGKANLEEAYAHEYATLLEEDARYDNSPYENRITDWLGFTYHKDTYHKKED